MINVERIRKILRINHTKLDDEILETIRTAKDELIRVGIPSVMFENESPLIDEAIKTYCLYSFTNDEKRSEAYFNSFRYQADCLRKSSRIGVQNEK